MSQGTLCDIDMIRTILGCGVDLLRTRTLALSVTWKPFESTVGMSFRKLLAILLAIPLCSFSSDGASSYSSKTAEAPSAEPRRHGSVCGASLWCRSFLTSCHWGYVFVGP